MQTKNNVVFMGLFILFLAFLPVYAARPQVSIQAVPSTINLGASSTLTWTSSNAVSASINQGIGSVPVNGSLMVSPTKTMTYTITVRNSSGSRTARAKITVKPALPTVTFSANPNSLLQGQSSTLNWTTSNATSASINQGIGSVALNGSKIVTPTATMTYTITVTGRGGTVTATVSVTVSSAPPTVSFNATPNPIDAGQSSTLSWTTSNATSATIDQGIGSVALSGTKVVMPAVSTTYTITVTGNGGTIAATAAVTMNAAQPTITISVEPMFIEAGQSSTLSWATNNATSASIDQGIGSVSLNGSMTVSPIQTTTYTLTATGPGGTITGEATIQVQGIAAPTVSLIANPQTIQPGGTATLTWTSANADSAYIDNNVGAVELNGTLTVSPASTTTYNVTVTGQGGTNSASATVIISNEKTCYAFIPDAYDKKIRIVNTNDNTLFKTLEITDANAKLQGVGAERSGVFTYVVDSGQTKLFKIDPLTMTVAGTLPLTANFQGSPDHIAVAPDGCHLYALSSVPMWDPYFGKYVGNICTIQVSGNNFSAIRLVGIELPSRVSLEGLAVSEDNTRLYVADPDNSQILVLDTAKLQRWTINPVMISDELITTIPLASPPLELALAPTGQMLYAMADSTLFEIDTLNFTVNRSLSVSNGSRFVKAHPDGSKIYVMNSSYLSIVETSGLTKTATIGISGLYSCSGLDIHPDGSRMFLVDKSSGKLFTLDTSTYHVLSTIALGTTPTAYGNFLSYLPLTIAGNVNQNGSGLSGVTMTLDGEGILRTKQTAAAGEFVFGLKPGNYKLTPTLTNLAFSPENMELQVSNNMPGLDFVVSGIIEPPTVTLTSSSTWVKQYESFILTWNSTGADYVTLEMATSDHLPPSGSRTFALQSTSTIWAVAYNRGGSASASVKVYVATTQPPTALISATPTSILLGANSTLSWTTTHASTITIDNGVGTVAANGSRTVSPTTTTTYTITATGSQGYQVTSSATIVVSTIPPPEITLTASPEILTPGASSTLTWTTTNATAVTINNDIGTVNLSGSKDVSPTQDTVYTATATGPGGTTVASVTVKMLDTHLRSIWGGMKTAMAASNVDLAVGFFSEETQENYREIYTALLAQLPQIVQEMGEIELLVYKNNTAIFQIKRNDIINSEEHVISYRIYFVYQNNQWSIYKY